MCPNPISILPSTINGEPTDPVSYLHFIFQFYLVRLMDSLRFVFPRTVQILPSTINGKWGDNFILRTLKFQFYLVRLMASGCGSATFRKHISILPSTINGPLPVPRLYLILIFQFYLVRLMASFARTGSITNLFQFYLVRLMVLRKVINREFILISILPSTINGKLSPDIEIL